MSICRKDQHYAGADGRSQIRLHTGDTDLAENRRQTGEYGGAGRVKEPSASLFRRPLNILFLDHQKSSGAYQENTGSAVNGDD